MKKNNLSCYIFVFIRIILTITFIYLSHLDTKSIATTVNFILIFIAFEIISIRQK